MGERAYYSSTACKVMPGTVRLEERGVLKNDNGTITSLISKDEAKESEIDELDEIQRMIDRIRKGDHNE